MEALTGLFTFEDYGALVSLLLNSILAAALLGVVGGLVSVFVMTRDIAFAVHGIAELSFAGAAFFLLVGFDVVHGSFVGSIIAAIIIAVGGVPRLGEERDHRRAHAVRAGAGDPLPRALRRACREQIRPPHRSDRRDQRGLSYGCWS